MKILKNNKGYSLIEIIAGLPLVALVFVIFGIGIVHFTTTYQEVRLYTQLQQDLFEAIEIMRHGYMLDGVTDDEGLIGLTTAKKIDLSSTAALKVTPLVLNQELENLYWVKYYVDDNMQLKVRGSYGASKNFNNEPIFPSTPIEYIDGDPQFTIKNSHNIWSVTPNTTDGMGYPHMVNIKLVGQVRFREKSRDQTNEDDIRKNTRTITYETSVFLGNAHSNTVEE